MFINTKGFTLIKMMILVVCFLGVLSIAIVPHLINTKSNTNQKELVVIKEALHTSVKQVATKAQMVGLSNSRNAVINIDGQHVRIRYGYPKSSQIFYQHANKKGLVRVGSKNALVKGNLVMLNHKNDCVVKYHQPKHPGQPPSIDFNDSGC